MAVKVPLDAKRNPMPSSTPDYGNRLQTESEHVMTQWGLILTVAQLLAGDTCCAQ
jgi:hypothetical protein